MRHDRGKCALRRLGLEAFRTYLESKKTHIIFLAKKETWRSNPPNISRWILGGSSSSDWVPLGPTGSHHPRHEGAGCLKAFGVLVGIYTLGAAQDSGSERLRIYAKVMQKRRFLLEKCEAHHFLYRSRKQLQFSISIYISIYI